MKKITILLLLTISFGLSNYTVQAQKYAFTLVDNGDYSYTIAAIPDFDSAGFEPITQSYGFVIVLPDGVTVTGNSYLPTGTAGTLTPINGGDVAAFDPEMADNDLYLVTTDTAGRKFPAHAVGDVIPLVTLTVNDSPAVGEISMLDNDSTLANAPELLGALDSFVQVDVIDNDIVVFANEFLGLTGTTTYDFATLGIGEAELSDGTVSLYPNPASEMIYIKSDLDILKVELYNILGKKVAEHLATTEIRIEEHASGIYLLKIHTNKGKLTKKLIVE